MWQMLEKSVLNKEILTAIENLNTAQLSLEKLLENSTKKMNCLQQRFAIQWYLARPCIIRGPDARTTRNFGIFFKLEVSYIVGWVVER